MRHILTRLFPVVAVVLTAGCASAPVEIREAPAGPPLAVVKNNPAQYTGQAVRWGGVIVKVDNQPTHTIIQIVARPLYSSGRPADTSNSPGRFLAQAAGFVEPTEYKKGREITVVGKIAGTRTQAIGEHPYTFPLIEVSKMYLWAEEPPYDPYRDRYYPYWDPWYPWGWGFWGHYRFHSHPYHSHRHRGHPRSDHKRPHPGKGHGAGHKPKK